MEGGSADPLQTGQKQEVILSVSEITEIWGVVTTRQQGLS